jgi:hypothetical protein
VHCVLFVGCENDRRLQTFPAAIETDDFNLFTFLDVRRESRPPDERIGAGEGHQHRAVLGLEGVNENFPSAPTSS